MDIYLPFVVLGLPTRLLSSLKYHDLEEFSKKIRGESLHQLFLSCFLHALDRRQSESYTKSLKPALERRRGEFFFEFVNICQDYDQFSGIIQAGKLHTAAADKIAFLFDVDPSFKESLTKVSLESLWLYRFNFLNSMREKEEKHLIRLLAGLRQEMVMQAVEEFGPKTVEQYRQWISRVIPARAGQSTVTVGPPRVPGKEKSQIKILALTPAPGNQQQYNMEQQRLKEAFKNTDPQTLLLDMPNPVKGTLETIREHLDTGNHHILYLACRGGIDKNSRAALLFQDSEGKAKVITVDRLVEALSFTPKMVILSTCQGNQQGSNLVPAARDLFNAAISTVIAMQKPLDYRAAVNFDMEFFGAFCKGISLQEAFARARGVMAKWNQQDTPQLMTREENLFISDLPSRTS